MALGTCSTPDPLGQGRTAEIKMRAISFKPNQHKTAESEHLGKFPQGMGTPAHPSKSTSPRETGLCNKAVAFPMLSHLPNTWEKMMWWQLAVLTNIHRYALPRTVVFLNPASSFHLLLKLVLH